MIEDRRFTTGHLLAALAVVVVGVLIGWATDGGGGGDGGQAPGADVGPTRTINGVPVGYERSREGAVAAALAYDTALARPELVTDPVYRRSVLAAVATPDLRRRYERPGGVVARTARAQAPLYRAIRSGEPAVWQTAPLSYRVARYTGDKAEIVGWVMVIIGVGDDPPVAGFSTGTTRVQWSDGDWKLAGGGGGAQDGPTPALVDGANRTSTPAFHERLRGLESLRHVP